MALVPMSTAASPGVRCAGAPALIEQHETIQIGMDWAEAERHADGGAIGVAAG